MSKLIDTLEKPLTDSMYKSILLLPAIMLIYLGSQAQVLDQGVLMPTTVKQSIANLSFLPDDGLNLYDKPDGEVIARLGRDRRSRDNPNYQLNIFLFPRDRTPELLSTTALAPLPNNCFALPFVKQENGHVLLFSDKGPYFYWVSLKELQQANYLLSEWPVAEPMIDTESKAGLIIPDFEKLNDLPREQFAYVPQGGLPLRNMQQQPVAMLSKFCPVGKYTDGHMRMFILPDQNPNNCVDVPLEQLHHWSDDAYVIPFYENAQGMVRLFNASSFGSTWVRISDITERNFLLLGWKDYFISRRSSPLFARGSGLNLRVSPYADANRITTIKGDTMQIYLTGYDEGFCEGPWCKVKVKVYKENPCTTQLSEEDNFTREYEGWIKLIDDSGWPNVFMNTKGC